MAKKEWFTALRRVNVQQLGQTFERGGQFQASYDEISLQRLTREDGPLAPGKIDLPKEGEEEVEMVKEMAPPPSPPPPKVSKDPVGREINEGKKDKEKS